MKMFIAVVALAFLSLILYGYTPVDAVALKDTVKLASSNAEAKAVLAAALQKTPNPNHYELASMSIRVNEIIVTETARVATGDKTLVTPTEQKRINEQQESMQQANRDKERETQLLKVKSKPLSDMTFHDFSVLFWSYMPTFLAIVFTAVILPITFFSVMSRLERRY